jgi:hypothetical protein
MFMERTIKNILNIELTLAVCLNFTVPLPLLNLITLLHPLP